MAQWYVKDLSRLTQISVQTLHHYDRIGLLQPSLRQANGYRLYSEKDLLTLQQIIALKFFGFELSQIKQLLAADLDIVEHFTAQSQFLEEQAKAMQKASDTLKTIISDCARNKSIEWETIIKLIEGYRMTRELEKSWVGKALNTQELKEYAKLEQELPMRFTKQEEEQCTKQWDAIVHDIASNLQQDPAGPIGIEIGKRCMEWVGRLYGSEYSGLRIAMWEKGFKAGLGAEEHKLSLASVDWLDKAMKAYHTDRIRSILSHPDQHAEKLWRDLMNEMCGDDQEKIRGIYTAVMQDDQISQAGKDWLKRISHA